MLLANKHTPRIVIQTALLTESVQKSMRTAAATISAGNETMVPYTVFQPAANESAGSTKCSACLTTAPESGNNADISAMLMTGATTNTPTRVYPNQAPRGPAYHGRLGRNNHENSPSLTFAMALPEPRKRPVPIAPARAII